jgi:hypothetical protein
MSSSFCRTRWPGNGFGHTLRHFRDGRFARRCRRNGVPHRGWRRSWCGLMNRGWSRPPVEVIAPAKPADGYDANNYRRDDGRRIAFIPTNRRISECRENCVAMRGARRRCSRLRLPTTAERIKDLTHWFTTWASAYPGSCRTRASSCLASSRLLYGPTNTWCHAPRVLEVTWAVRAR